MRPLMLFLLFGSASFAIVPARADDAEAEKNAIAKIRESGALVLEIAQNDNRLDVSYLTAQGKVTNELLAPLKDLTKLAQLNLRGTEVTDDGLTPFADKKNARQAAPRKDENHRQRAGEAQGA